MNNLQMIIIDSTTLDCSPLLFRINNLNEIAQLIIQSVAVLIQNNIVAYRSPER